MTGVLIRRQGHTEGRPCEDTRRRQIPTSPSERPQEKPALLASGSQTSSLRNSERIDFCCFKSPRGFPGGSVVKNPPANAGDLGSIPGSRRSPGGGNGNPLQYSRLDIPMDRGAWRATVNRVEKSWTLLNN